MPQACGAARALPSRPRRRWADGGRPEAPTSSAEAKRPEGAPPRRARRWRAKRRQHRLDEPTHLGAEGRAPGSAARTRRALWARRKRATRRDQRSRKASREPVIRARSRYLSRPSAMRRCRVATQCLGLRSRIRLSG